MKTRVLRRALIDELSLLQGIVERRSTIPILSHVLLDTFGERLHLAATDLDVSLTTSCGADVSGEGAIAVQARKFTEIVRSLGSDEVVLEIGDGDVLIIEGGTSRFRIRGHARENFPTLPKVEDETASFELSLSTLKGMISRVVFAISSEESRFQLQGALLRHRPGALELVATDGHRLALVERGLDTETDAEGQVLVPRKALLELLRFEGGDSVAYRQGPFHLSFRLGARELVCRILEGNFPDYAKVLSPELDKRVVFDRVRLLDAVQRVALLTGDRVRGVKLDVDEGEAVISAANPDLGEATERVPCEAEGGPIALGINPDYLAQFLGAVETEKVRLELKDEQTQCVGYPVDDGEQRYVCVIMPMRV